MIYRILAEAVVLVHLSFVVFAVCGGLLVCKWPRLAWGHLPVAVWAALVEFGGWICPLTPLENWLRLQGGDAGYGAGYVERYLLPFLYPGQMTRSLQIGLGMGVLAINVAVYAVAVQAARRRHQASSIANH